MAIYQIHPNIVPVRNPPDPTPPPPLPLGWLCDTQAEADEIAASLGGPGLVGTNGIDRHHANIGDIVRIVGDDQIQIIRSNGTLKKL